MKIYVHKKEYKKIKLYLFNIYKIMLIKLLYIIVWINNIVHYNYFEYIFFVNKKRIYNYIYSYIYIIYNNIYLKLQNNKKSIIN